MLGLIAQDVASSKIDKEWSNFVSKGKDDYLRLDYGQMGVISWGAIQCLMNEIINILVIKLCNENLKRKQTLKYLP